MTTILNLKVGQRVLCVADEKAEYAAVRNAEADEAVLEFVKPPFSIGSTYYVTLNRWSDVTRNGDKLIFS